MSGCENILRADLVKSENFTNIVLPNRRRLTKARQEHIYTAGKADSLRRFYFGSLDGLATFKGGQPLFIVFIAQILSRMPNRENLAAGAPGVPDATANARKRVESILKLSNEEIANTFSNLTHEQLIELAPLLRVAFCTIECFLSERSSNLEKSKSL